MKLKRVDKNKKGISPIITTILLVLLAIILAAIILMWGLTFIPESLSKFGSPIEDRCTEVSFTASVLNNELTLVNNGNIPIYEVGVKEKSGPNSEIVYEVVNLNPGATNHFTISSSASELEIMPVILGETEDNEIQKYSCKNEEVWETVSV